MTEPTHTDRPENGSSITTVVGLRDYYTRWLVDMERFDSERDRRYEDRFRSQDEKTTLALTASKEAINKAETANEKRFDTVNEFRGTLSDQAATLLPRAEANAKFENYDEKLGTIQKLVEDLRLSRSVTAGAREQQQEGRAQSNWTFNQTILIIVGVVGIAEFLIRTFVKP